jgi:hypothetical protein
LPTASVARTLNVYDPFARLEYAFGDVHEPYVPVVVPGPSSLHWNVSVASLLKPKLALFVVIVPVGPVSIVVCGAVVSTLNERVAGLASVIPLTVARALNV